MNQADDALVERPARQNAPRARIPSSSAQSHASTSLRAFVAVALLAASSTAIGLNEERARAYFARELAECGAYYALVAEAPGLDEVTRIQFRAAGISMVSTSADIATEPWGLAQRDLAAETIRREMGNSWNNYAVVGKKYRQHCYDIATDPAARWKYWRNKYH